MSELLTPEQWAASAAKRYVFPFGNTTPFFMDFPFWHGVPHDLVFYEREGEHYNPERTTLVARGYGMKGDYGNGSIFVNRDKLPAPLP